MPKIHPTAIVSPESVLADDCDIGPWCVLTGPVTLGAGVRLVGNVHLNGPVTLGSGTIAYPFVCVGFPGQDVKFKLGMPTPGVRVGVNCILRENVTIHSATRPEAPTIVARQRVHDGVFASRARTAHRQQRDPRERGDFGRALGC